MTMSVSENHLDPGSNPIDLSDDPQATAIWEALTSDTTCRIALLDAEGKVLYCNRRLNEQFAEKAAREDLIGANLRDFHDEDYAEERIEFVRTVIRTGKPLVVNGVLRGVCIRTAFRPFPYGPDRTLGALAICREVADFSPSAWDDVSDGDVVDAEVRDLGPLSTLTPRELLVLSLIGQGLSTAEIAKRFNRSEKTIEWHRTGLARKLGARNRVELARIAVRAGLSPGPLPTEQGEGSEESTNGAASAPGA